MIDVFAVAPREVRSAKLEEYRSYLLERDGEMDIAKRTLSKRETVVAKYETQASLSCDLNATEFRTHFESFNSRMKPSEEMMLLLALVKTNAAEAYGVETGAQHALKHALATNDDIELRVLCEETYHTRILLSSANLYGIEATAPYTPPSALRVLIAGIAHTPASMSRPLVLAAEIIATLTFVKLLDVARRVLKGKPDLRDAVEERLIDICTDERGHISYNRMRSGPVALAQTRAILGMTAMGMKTVCSEVCALGAFPDLKQDLALLNDRRRLPASVVRDSFVA